MPDLTYNTLLAALRNHIGRERGTTASALLVREIRGATSPGDERHLRTLIVDLRNCGHHVCGHPSTGYFLAATAEEMEEICQFLRNRAMTSLVQESRMRGVSIPDLIGQMRLPT